MSLPTSSGETLLSPELEQRVQSELAGGERLVWVGQPRPGRLMLMAIPIVIFAIPWTAFACFWVFMASSITGGIKGAQMPFRLFGLIFPLFGLPFVLIGLGMFSAPYWIARRARRTCYAVTDRRAIIWEPGLFGSVQVIRYRPEDLRRMSRTERSDGSGDLIFEETLHHDTRGHRQVHRRGFFAIVEVRAVEELVRKALKIE